MLPWRLRDEFETVLNKKHDANCIIRHDDASTMVMPLSSHHQFQFELEFDTVQASLPLKSCMICHNLTFDAFKGANKEAHTSLL